MPLPIARFNVVPGQAFNQPFNIGVVAFHAVGIARVDLELRSPGGDSFWQMSSAMSYNPHSATSEYWCTFDPADLEPGRYEVYAQVFAQSGMMLEIGPLPIFIHSPAKEFLATPETLADALMRAQDHQDRHRDDHSTIKLAPGVYRYPEVNSYAGWDRWLTVQPTEGVWRDQVVFTHGANPIAKWLRLRGVTLRQQRGDQSILACRSSNFDNHFWLDGCRLEGTGHLGPNKSTAPALASGDALSWYTDCEIVDTAASGLHNGVQLARNVRGVNIGGDFINHSTMSVNCRVDRMRFDAGAHPDVVQYQNGPVDNMIIYGLEAYDVRAQGITIGNAEPVRNVALVDIRMEKGQDAGEDVDPQVSRLPRGSITDNVYMRRVLSRSYTWELVGADRTNLSIRECQFNNVVKQPGFSVAGQDVRDNIFGRQQDAFSGESA